MKPKIIAVVGGKKVGKTTTTENLIAELSSRGYRVAAIKHISEPQWTIDTPGKDTHRFAQKGAKTIVAVGHNEIDTIEKGPTENVTLAALVKKAGNCDVIITEGLKKTVAKKADVVKIVVITGKDQAEEALRKYKPILAFSGPFDTSNLFPKMPYVNGLTQAKELADLAEEKVLKSK